MDIGVIILAIIQGIAEFLPISSSGHLLFIPWLFNNRRRFRLFCDGGFI